MWDGANWPPTCKNPNSNKFQSELRFIDEVVKILAIGKDQSRISVLQFAKYVGEEVSFDQSVALGKEKLMTAVRNIGWTVGVKTAHCPGKQDLGTKTATPLAMTKAKKIFEQFGRMKDESVLKFVFILTDGKITVPTQGGGKEALAVAQELNKMGVTTYSIGVSRNEDEAMKRDLLNMAAGKENHRFMVTKFEDLKEKVLGTIQNTLNCDV